MIMQSVTRGNNFQWYTVNLCSCTEGYIFKLSIQSCEHEISGTLRLNDEMIRFQWSTGQGHWGLDVYHIIQRPPRWNVQICGAAGWKICVCVCVKHLWFRMLELLCSGIFAYWFCWYRASGDYRRLCQPLFMSWVCTWMENDKLTARSPGTTKWWF